MSFLNEKDEAQIREFAYGILKIVGAGAPHQEDKTASNQSKRSDPATRNSLC